MKKFCFFVLALSLGIGLTAGLVFADSAPPRATAGTPYMTLNLSETAKTQFGWDETPYLFLWLPIVDATKTLNITNIWKFGNTVVDTQNLTSSITPLKDWFTLSDWLTERQVGDWSVTTTWGYDDSKYKICCQETKFTITPEPISAALFLIGAGFFGASRFRKNKNIKSKIRS